MAKLTREEANFEYWVAVEQYKATRVLGEKEAAAIAKDKIQALREDQRKKR